VLLSYICLPIAEANTDLNVIEILFKRTHIIDHIITLQEQIPHVYQVHITPFLSLIAEDWDVALILITSEMFTRDIHVLPINVKVNISSLIEHADSKFNPVHVHLVARCFKSANVCRFIAHFRGTIFTLIAIQFIEIFDKYSIIISG